MAPWGRVILPPMGQMFILLLRILFPLDKVARSRELMRAWLQMVMGWVADPEDVEGFAYWADDRAKLEGHVCALEHAMQVLIHERARDLLGLPFIYFPRQRNPKIRHPNSMSQLFKRLTQLARNFHNLDELAAKRANRIKRERDSNPLRLAATPQSTSPTLRAVEANHQRTFDVQIASTTSQKWGRWIGASSRRDGGGGAFPRGPPSHQSTAYCRLPIASALRA